MRFSVSQYNSLQLCQRAVVLGSNALFMMNFSNSGIIYSLYYYSEFYIEVLIDEDSSNLIDIIAFREIKRLDKYLENIALSGF